MNKQVPFKLKCNRCLTEAIGLKGHVGKKHKRCFHIEKDTAVKIYRKKFTSKQHCGTWT